MVEDLLKIRTREIIDKGVVAEERDARLELRDLYEELRRHLRPRRTFRRDGSPAGRENC